MKKILFSGLLLATIFGCDKDSIGGRTTMSSRTSAEDADGMPKTLSLVCAHKRIQIKQTIHCSAQALVAKGARKDVTDKSEWESSDDGIGLVSNDGELTGVKEGIIVIKATYRNAVAKATITVVPEGTLPDPDDLSPERALGNFSVENPLAARPTSFGKFVIHLFVRFLRQSDRDLVAEYQVRTVDFVNPTFEFGERIPVEGFVDLFEQELIVRCDYKYVPEVTRYKGQKLVVHGTTDDGENFNLIFPFSIKSTPEGESPDAPPVVELDGEEGHPNAQP